MITPLDLRLLPGVLGAWGICVIALRTDWVVLALIATAITTCVALAWPRKNVRHRTAWRGWLSLTIVLGCLTTLAVGAIGVTQIKTRAQRVEALLEDSRAGSTYTVRLTSEVSRASSGYGAHGHLLEIDRGGASSTERIPIYLLNASPTWEVGIQVQLRGSLSRGREQMIFLRVQTTVNEKPGQGMAALVSSLRDGVRQSTAGLSPYPRGLIPGVSIGDTRRIPEQLDHAMKVTSLSHITAVSGAHVAIVLATIMMALSRVRPLFKAVIALGVLVIMVLVVLPTPSVLRASTMGSLTLLALMTGRPRLALPSLFAVVIALLLIDPWLATSIGFSLSVAATAGILVLTGPIAARLGGGLLARLVAVPVAAQLSCAPLLLTFEASLALYAVPANILAMPALAPATILGLLSAVFSLFSPGAALFLSQISQVFPAWIATVALFFAGLPGAKLPWIGGGLGIASLVLILLGAYLVLVQGILRRT